ncbi:MAG: alanine racemase [Gammaproteobacteria bacterium HGW-Gammaproteobacteria-7]|nr:MAG: alanine racemase [Gammaproteobacteria bacterium HGW-Gammaproteobacteria-7]
MLLSGFDAPDDLDALRRLDVEPVLHHDSQLRILETADHRAGEGGRGAKRIHCWIKLDTGMHRLGFAPERAREVRDRLARLSMVHQPSAWMTHFARSDEFDQPATREQMARFDAALSVFAGDQQGAPRSLANSAGVLGWPASHESWIRPGGALYGISVVAGRSGTDFGLQPAMTLGTRLIAINRVGRGEPVGYGGDYRAPEDMPVGVAAIGYGDGYPRHAASGTPVLVNGAPAALIGRVSMDLMTIDLRGQPQAEVGDPVTLWGEGLPVETIAESAGTIGYELVCSITRRVRFLER